MLERFLKNNSWSTVATADSTLVVSRPWADDTLELVFPIDDAATIDSLLSDVVLPPRFEGLHHIGSGTLELFFTQLSPADPLLGKSFRFTWRGTQYECRYGKSSAEAQLLATSFKAKAHEPEAEYRGLARINRLRVFELIGPVPQELREAVGKDVPTSFFVTGLCEFVETDVVALAKHLNFYMGYFWRRTPAIIVRDVSVNELGALPAPRDTSPADLPEAISAPEIDSYLLELLLTARHGNARLRFIQHYQVLEYSAFYWTEDSVRAAVRRVLAAPDLLTRLDEYVPRVIDALTSTRATDEHKIRRIVETSVDPKLLWPEIAHGLSFFSQPVQFDGGFAMEALVSPNCNEESFIGMWTPKLTDAIRQLRNALVHGRESRQQAVIAPTVANDRRLTPWLPVIQRIAEQVSIHSGG